MHFLMRPAINAHPLDWQQAQTRLTPKRVRQRWVLALGRCWVRLWLRPEPLPKIGDSVTMHIYDPSQCLKSP